MAQIVLTILLISFPCSVLAFDTKVVWAGVGFSGDWGDRNRYYPSTSKIYELEGNPIQAWARERIVTSEQYPFELKLGQIEEESLDKIALAITFTGETVAYEKLVVDGKTEYIGNFSLSGAAIFFNLESNKLIATTPLITRYTNVYQSIPDQNEQHKIFKAMLSSDELDLNFFSEMVSRLKNVNLSTLPSQFIQVNSFTVDEDVHSAVAASEDLDIFKYFLSTFFENRLSGSSGIAVIPNKVGHVVGNKIATRLPSGDRTLILPEPGFTIDLRVHKLVYQNEPENKSTDCLCWGGLLSVAVEDRRFKGAEEELAKVGFRNVNCCYVDTGVTLEDYVEFQKLMMGLLEGVANQFNEIDKDWLGEKALDSKQARKSIEEASELFKEAMF